MHSSRMRTVRCSGNLSCHACLPPAMHVPSTLPHKPTVTHPPTMHAPLSHMTPATHATCHASHPLPHMPSCYAHPSAMPPPATPLLPCVHAPCCHTSPLPCMPASHAHPACHACPPPHTSAVMHAPLPCTSHLWTDRHLLKHYLSATTVADCKHMPGCSMVQTQHLFCIKTGSCRAGLVRQGQRSFEGKSFLIARKLNCYGVHICSPSS